MVKRMMFILSVIGVSAAAFAQEAAQLPAEKLPIAWGPIAATGIGVVVMLLVQVVSFFVPRLQPGVKQIIAMVASPLLTWAASLISNALGYPVDFSSLIQAIVAAAGSGLTAMGTYDVLKTFGLLGKKKAS